MQQFFSSKLFKTGERATLTVYQCQPKKDVSSVPYVSQRVFLCMRKKARNCATKCGVDGANQMARLHSVKADTRRWPVAVFHNILDFACINAFVFAKCEKTRKFHEKTSSNCLLNFDRNA